jgi:hypothetical protein
MCALCRRNLLAGERYRHWEPGEGERAERAVCGLCEPEARDAGWVRSAVPARREPAAGLRLTVRLVA